MTTLKILALAAGTALLSSGNMQENRSANSNTDNHLPLQKTTLIQ
ncbi:hypothetical protein [Chryseobacterium sp.]